jgi:hypothetical protein
MLKDSTLAEGTARSHTATLMAPQLIRVQMFNDDVSVYSLSYGYSLLAENDCSDIQFTPANT